MEIWLLPKKIPVLLQRTGLPTGQFELMIPFDPRSWTLMAGSRWSLAVEVPFPFVGISGLSRVARVRRVAYRALVYWHQVGRAIRGTTKDCKRCLQHLQFLSRSEHIGKVALARSVTVNRCQIGLRWTHSIVNRLLFHVRQRKGVPAQASTESGWLMKPMGNCFFAEW